MYYTYHVRTCKSFILALTLFFMLTCLNGILLAEENEKYISITVKDLSPKVHKWMEPVYVEIEVVNLSNANLEISWGDQAFIPAISAFYSQDEKIKTNATPKFRYELPLTRYGRKLLTDSTVMDNSTKILKPKEKVSKKIHINRMYDMSATTKANVVTSINYVDPQGKMKKAISEEITVNIEGHSIYDLNNKNWP